MTSAVAVVPVVPAAAMEFPQRSPWGVQNSCSVSVTALLVRKEGCLFDSSSLRATRTREGPTVVNQMASWLFQIV